MVRVVAQGADGANVYSFEIGTLVAPELFAELGHNADHDVTYWIVINVKLQSRSATRVDLYACLRAADDAEIDAVCVDARAMLHSALARRSAGVAH